MKLLIISDAPILTDSEKKVAYAPYVKEMDLWMQQASEIFYVCPFKYDRKLLTQPLKKQDFKQIGLRRLEFHTLLSAIISFLTIPYQAIVLWNAMRKANHIHLRCPGNLALLASMIQVTLPRKRKTVKYAGNFDPNAPQPFAYRLQKRILSSTFLTKNIEVLVYGEWPDQSKNIKPFFTATYSEKDKANFKKEFKEPYQFIFVGTLSQNKNPDLLLELIKRLNQNGIPSQAHFYGDGPMMEALKKWSSEFSIQNENLSDNNLLRNEKVSPFRKWPQDNDAFHFYGNQPKEIVQEAYQKAHFSFLASQSEGWPKAVAESMWYGCIPVASPVSCVPWMLGSSNNAQIGSRGIIYKDLDQVVAAITYLLNNNKEMDALSQNAQNWSQLYTLEKFESEIVKLLQS